MDCNRKPSAKRTARCFALLCCLAITLPLGCSKTSTLDIHGKVTFQGKPLESGVICFVPTDGKGKTITADIKDGQYALKLSLGQKRVEISSIGVVGQQQVMLGGQLQAVDVKKETIPVKYNQESTLRADISTDGSEELDFNL